MRYLFLLLLLLSNVCDAQTYTDSLLAHRQHYREEFLTDTHSPLKEADTAFLRFFSPDAVYRVTAAFKATPKAKPFNMPTHSGKTKNYRQYGLLIFRLHDTLLTLHVYQSLDLIKKDIKYKKHLFVPFTDGTTYDETYGGGRYIDLSTDDIVNGNIVLDFNKCYNPYCAYAGGYSCPIPPVENRLPVAIRAGEKNFGKEPKE